MTDHKHEWSIDNDNRWFKCECGESPSTEDILRSLNATECLSTEDAKEIYIIKGGKTICPALIEYARILEGKDD